MIYHQLHGRGAGRCSGEKDTSRMFCNDGFERVVSLGFGAHFRSGRRCIVIWQISEWLPSRQSSAFWTHPFETIIMFLLPFVVLSCGPVAAHLKSGVSAIFQVGSDLFL